MQRSKANALVEELALLRQQQVTRLICYNAPLNETLSLHAADSA